MYTYAETKNKTSKKKKKETAINKLTSLKILKKPKNSFYSSST